MTPHQVLALGVRLFVIWYAFVMLREALAFLTVMFPADDPQALAFTVGVSIVSLLILLVLWFFPKSIARGLLPTSSEVLTQTLSYQLWFSLGTALIGLWFAASAIGPILRNLSIMYVFRPDLLNVQDLLSLRSGIFYYVFQLVLGLFLLFGANSLRRFIWWARRAGPD
jgi:hypothetical protein